MKKTVHLGLLLIVLLGFSNCNNTNDQFYYDQNYAKEIKTVRKEFAYFIARNYVPGASIAILKNGKLVYSEGLGYASKDLDVPVTRKTKFRIAQVTEPFTALAYQFLVEDGILNPDSIIQHYYPEFPKKELPITIHHLVNHTSGIRKAYGSEKEDRGLKKNLKTGLDMFKNDPLSSAPNMYVEPSMFNYNLLGVVMEKATGKKFKKLMHELVIDKLHLENTELDDPYITIKNRSNFFESNVLSQVTNGFTCDLRFRAPDQGLLSNAEDLVKFGNAMLESDAVTEAIRERLFKTEMLFANFPSDFSNGWFISETIAGDKYYVRSGSVLGGGSTLLIFPEEKLILAVAVNVNSVISNLPILKLSEPFLSSSKEKIPETE